MMAMSPIGDQTAKSFLSTVILCVRVCVWNHFEIGWTLSVSVFWLCLSPLPRVFLYFSSEFVEYVEAQLRSERAFTSIIISSCIWNLKTCKMLNETAEYFQHFFSSSFNGRMFCLRFTFICFLFHFDFVFMSCFILSFVFPCQTCVWENDLLHPFHHSQLILCQLFRSVSQSYLAFHLLQRFIVFSVFVLSWSYDEMKESATVKHLTNTIYLF